MLLALFVINSDLHLCTSLSEKKGLLFVLRSWWVGCTEEEEKCRNDLGEKWKIELYFSW